MAVRPIDANALQERLYRLGLWNDSRAAFYELIESMPTLTPPNEWVRVEDRLPEKGENVLVYAIAKHIGVTKISIDKLEEGERRPVWLYTHGWFEVTHWMPLPAPPDRRPPEGEKL